MNFTYTQSEITEIAEKIITLSASKTFLLYGEMGVGKTTLIKEIVQLLGVKSVSGSPSFSIINEYEATDGVVYHFDFYRIDSVEEAFDIGVEDYFYSGNYIFIEWPKKIEAILPENATNIYITKNANGSRTLRLVV
ncbi:tRNA (adenosine(37)-N6)-threonylcarbamoyltransferase complex ATPase subunit type 1 TsaE [Aequorivita sp. Q41]|uniref:tRNA (adenosine(37)-N6)-threonylcarbamoyltransferase complex ATPase subunit type 1 TsaE n=1 Tax=Aequorivita sp. Q41 TaxID=3153300 RepID=UPI0032427A21